MSTENETDPKPASEGDSKPKTEEVSDAVPERKVTQIYYCEMCKVPCMSAMTLQAHYAGIKHKKRERALEIRRKYPPTPVVYEEPAAAKKPLSKNIKCLRDYIKDPERDEPLIGLEYVVEIRFKGRREPCYQCQLCAFQSEMVHMLVHLTGQKHRRVYLNKHYPERAKRNQHDGVEDRARFLKRIAREIENTEGLKKYKREKYEREYTASAAAQMKAIKFGAGYKPKNDADRRGKAWDYLETFVVTSDEEATQVVRLAQTLTGALKAFCDKQATLKYIKTLRPLMPFGKKSARRPFKIPENGSSNPEGSVTSETPVFEETSIPEDPVVCDSDTAVPYEDPMICGSDTAVPYEDPVVCGSDTAVPYEDPVVCDSDTAVPNGPSMTDVSQPDSNQLTGFARWASRRRASKRLSSGLAQLQTLMHPGQCASSTPAEPYVPLVEETPASMSAPESSFPLDQNFTYGIEEQGMPFEQPQHPLPNHYLPPPCEEQPVLFTPPQSSYVVQQPEDAGIHIPTDPVVNPWEGNPWPSMRVTAPLDIPSYPLPESCQTNPIPQEIPFNLHNGLEISDPSKPYYSVLEKEVPVWPQQSYYQQPIPEGNLGSYSLFPGAVPQSDYEQQNAGLSTTVGVYDSDFAASLSALRGKDAATLASMLQQLVPHYPDLQKIDILALAQALSEMS